MRTILLSLLIAIAMTMMGCHQHSGDEHHHDSHEGHDHSEDFIFFTQEQADAANMKVEILSPDTFRQVIKTSGIVMASQGDEYTISSTANGIVSFYKSSIVPGTVVKAGEPIVTVSSNALPEGDRIAKTKLAYETALKEFERASSLVKDQIISVKEYEQIRLAYETAKMEYEAQASNYSKNGVRVTSSINGFVKTFMLVRVILYLLDNR